MSGKIEYLTSSDKKTNSLRFNGEEIISSFGKEYHIRQEKFSLELLSKLEQWKNENNEKHSQEFLKKCIHLISTLSPSK